MAQANFTPIQLYRSTTASAVPTSGNLADGELAINTNDGKLYYKDSGGTVQLIASKAGASGDVVGPASATDNAVVRFDGTTGKLVQNSVVTIADSTGDIAGAGSITSTSASGILTRAAATQDGVELIGRAGGSSSYKVTLTPTTLGGNRTLTLPDTTGTVALTGSTVASFSAGSTGFTPNSATTGAVTLAGTLATTNGGTGLTSFTANGVVYASSSSVLATGSAVTYNGTTFATSADASISGLTVGKGAGAVSSNTAVGASALAANTSGSLNTVVGYQAGASNITSAGLSLLGYQAGTAATAGNITAVGYQALFSNTTGLYNTAIGQLSLYSNTTASNNTAVGYQAGYSNTTGAGLTAVGYQALITNSTGGYNTAVGFVAGNSTTTGNNNVFLGRAAGYTNQTGGYNVFVGYYAGYTSNKANDGAGNTAIGTYAGYSLTTGDKNTFVGGNVTNGGAGYSITTGSANTIIGSYNGNQGGLDIRTSNNYIVLSDGDGNPRATWFPNGWVFGYPTYTPLTDEQVVAADNANGSMSAFLAAAAPNGGQAGVRLRAGVGTTYRATRIDFYQTPASTTIPRWTLINDYDQNNTNDFRLYSGVYGDYVQNWRPDGTTRVSKTLGVGNANGSTSGAGITFPATQSASSDANTLDDYEEGTWTPTLTNATSYSTQVGRYVKIGKLVYINADIVCAFNNTGAGNQKIGGLPFTIENVTAMYPVGTIFPVQGFNQSTMNISTQGDVNATTVTLYTSTPSTGVNYAFVAPTTFGTTVEFEFSMVYRAAD